MSLILTHRLTTPTASIAPLLLSLTAEERTRSRHYFVTADGQGIHLRLPRGTVLHHGDWLSSETGDRVVQIVAKPEPVLTVTATTPLALLKAAYHLGNRHVPLEVKETYLRLSPDSVLFAMLHQMGVQVIEEIAPFAPEAGAYGQNHHHELSQSDPSQADSLQSDHSHDHFHDHSYNHIDCNSQDHIHGKLHSHLHDRAVENS